MNDIPEDEDELTEPGWPRPVVRGWPVPWVSPASDLASIDAFRASRVVAEVLCQVCGLGHEPGARVFFCASENNEGTSRDADLSELLVRPMDGAVMHERCARLAVRRCPVLGGIRGEGKLLTYSARVEDVEVRDLDDERVLLVPGSAARLEGSFE